MLNALSTYFDTSRLREIESIYNISQVYTGTLDYDFLTGNLCVYSNERAKQIASGFEKQAYVAQHRPLKNDRDPLDNLDEPLIDSVNRYWDPEHEPDLWARIVTNPFPVISFEYEGCAPGVQDMFIARPFDRTFADFTIEETIASLELLTGHYYRLAKNNDIREVAIFQNYGDVSPGSRENGGETQPHPHLQIWGFPFITPVQHLQISAHRFWTHKAKEKEQNIFHIADKMAHEHNTVVYENESFLVYAPSAPRTNYTVRIIPRNARASNDIFGPSTPHTTSPHITECALAISAATKAVKYALNDPAYNMLIHAPLQAFTSRWFIDIHPRINAVKSGMEQLTGVDAIGIYPEVAAETLRSAL